MRGFALCILFVLLGSPAARGQKFSSETSGTQPVLAGAPDNTWIADYDLRSGAVYIMTNREQNGVVAFARERNSGWLRPVGLYETGGSGSYSVEGVPQLASQSSLVLNQDRTLLFAVNPGSHSITVFRIGSRTLTRAAVVPSGGKNPVSIAVFDDLVYVLNDSPIPTITGFTVGDSGQMTPIPNSTRALSSTGPDRDPVQIGFNNEGSLLIVTDRAGKLINTFTVDVAGKAGKPNRFQSEPVPGAFTFTSAGHLIVAESSDGKSALSSYDPGPRGALTPITGSMEGADPSPCCIAVTGNALFAFVASSDSGMISSYRIGDDGSLRPNITVAAGGQDSRPVGMAMSYNCKFLYVLDSGRHMIVGYEVSRDGGLNEVFTFGPLLDGVYGIAAK